jgi:hypothetical protein
MAANQSARSLRRSAPKPAPKPAQLRVVRPDDRVRTVGAISTAVAGFFFLVMFALAGLHAVVVQTQSELDDVNSDIAALEELRVNTLAERAWAESPVGLAAIATAAGYVQAAEVVNLTLVAPGRLAPPVSADPFAGGAAG